MIVLEGDKMKKIIVFIIIIISVVFIGRYFRNSQIEKMKEEQLNCINEDLLLVEKNSKEAARNNSYNAWWKQHGK